MVLDVGLEVDEMSWIAYYVEVSAEQRDQELARRAQRGERPATWEPRPRPRPRRRGWRRWVPPRPRAARAEATGAPVRPAAT